MTCNVFSGTLNLTQSLSSSYWYCNPMIDIIKLCIVVAWRARAYTASERFPHFAVMAVTQHRV